MCINHFNKNFYLVSLESVQYQSDDILSDPLSFGADDESTSDTSSGRSFRFVRSPGKVTFSTIASGDKSGKITTINKFK